MRMPDSERADAILAAAQNYEASVAATERLAHEMLVATRRLHESFARREEALRALLALQPGDVQ